MLKVSVFLVNLLFLSLIVTSCSREEETVDLPQKGLAKLELHVGISDFEENEKTNITQTPAESGIKNISLFLFYPDGREFVQDTRKHNIDGGKVSLTVPEDVLVNGLSAYLVANEEVAADSSPITEEELLRYKTTRAPEEFIIKGFPMSTAKIETKSATSSFYTAAVLQRTPSVIYVQVDSPNGLESIKNNSYKIEVEGLQVSEGAMFYDTSSSVAVQGKTDYSSKLTAVNIPESFAYFYQSGEIKIHITPKDPNLGQTKTVMIDNVKAAGRNKRFLLKITPVQTLTRGLDFTLKVADWDTEVVAVDMPFVTLGDQLLFAEGTSLELGWYDLNKSWGAGGFSQDSEMCWAITESNMIQWWQDRYVAMGNTLPANVPDGFVPGRKDELYRQLSVFEEFYVKNYKNIQNTALTGIPKYFTHYFPDIFPNTDPFFVTETYAKMKYPDTLEEFSDFLISGLKNRAVFYFSSEGHARTLWGCKYNPQTNIVKEIYLTDSDDRDVVMWERIPIKVASNGYLMAGPKRVAYLCALYAYPGVLSI